MPFMVPSTIWRSNQATGRDNKVEQNAFGNKKIHLIDIKLIVNGFVKRSQ